jgi:hypothetical protein
MRALLSASQKLCGVALQASDNLSQKEQTPILVSGTAAGAQLELYDSNRQIFSGGILSFPGSRACT